MTYFSFLFRFVFIPILIFLTIALWDNKRNKHIRGFRNGRAVWMAIGIHIFLAVTYTTPWDNYLVATGVWHYNPDLVTGIMLGYVPIEEYTFFIVETILAGLWWWFLSRRLSSPPNEFKANQFIGYLSTCLLVLLWILSAFLLFFGNMRWTYLSITLFWGLPAILPQLLFGADILWHYRRLVFWSIMGPGIYLSLMDSIALSETTWSISKTQTAGVLFFGILPVEEVVFFFITNVLITFGMTLLLAEESKKRFPKFYTLCRMRVMRSAQTLGHRLRLQQRIRE